ncbi:MAG TPA: class I SAM-dependent methyltransferase [Gaiellaceae bacterium]|nr:class I SAM-dependent methyltransferase [Gaiellaceae bacterium]
MSELQHPDSRTFEQVADLYERVRPSYPDEAVTWLADRLGIGAGSTVLDLGAGTGKLTRILVRRAARVIAVEPGPEMLAQLRRAVPEAQPVLGSAEAIPLPDDVVDAVVCGQSFHWFRTDEALREIRRVLRAGRGLGLIWNVRDPDDSLQNEITKLLEPFVPPGRPSLRAAVSAFVGRTFSEVEIHSVPFAQELDADGVVDRVASISFVAGAPEAKRRELQEVLRTLVGARGGRVAFRYVTESYVTFSVG